MRYLSFATYLEHITNFLTVASGSKGRINLKILLLKKRGCLNEASNV
jgi:hypothetical protein